MLVKRSTALSCVGVGRIINPKDRRLEARSLEVARICRSMEVMESSIMGKMFSLILKNLISDFVLEPPKARLSNALKPLP